MLLHRMWLPRNLTTGLGPTPHHPQCPAPHRVVLEIEYYGEVGTGLGPTLEFYTLLSHDLQRKDMGLWRHDDREPAASEPDATATTDASGPDSMDVDSPPEASAASASASASAAPTPTASAACGSMRPEVVSHEGGAVEYVNAPNGLFPAPLAPGERAAGSKAVEGFRLLGRAVGKALQDSRLMDLPLNYVFYRWAEGGRGKLLVPGFAPHVLVYVLGKALCAMPGVVMLLHVIPLPCTPLLAHCSVHSHQPTCAPAAAPATQADRLPPPPQGRPGQGGGHARHLPLRPLPGGLAGQAAPLAV